MDKFITYANGVEKPVFILDSVFAEEFFNKKSGSDICEIRERIEKVAQMMKKQINRK